MEDNKTLTNGYALETFSKLVLGAVNLRRIFLLLTQLHFSDPKNYGAMEDELKNFVWNKDKTKSKLFIDLDYVYDPAKSDQFPGIYVGVGDIDFKKVLMGNHESYTPDNAGSKNILHGLTTIIIRHASLSPDEALALADLSFGYYTGIRELLMERMKLKEFSIQKLSTPRFFHIDGTEKADKKYVADLIMNLAYDATWTTFRESHRIKKITFGQLTDHCGWKSGLQ
jgi:hypothetical protein